MLRECIEAVKQNKYTKEVEKIFIELKNGYKMPYILGCTELPILYEKYMNQMNRMVYDTLLITLKRLKEEYGHE